MGGATGSKSCKRCGGALPAGNVGIGECSGCGAIYGILPESREYIEAVFAESERPPPPPRAVSGMRARWRGRFGQGPAFRSNERREATGELTVDYSERGRPKDLVLFAVAVAAPIFVGWCFFRIGLEPWLLVPAALTTALAYFALGRIRMRLSVVIRDGLLTYTNVRHGVLRPVVQSIPVSELRQLYVAHVPETSDSPAQFDLRARKQDETAVTLESFLSPAVPLLLEQLIERALGIGDQPEPGELDRHVPVPRPSNVHAAVIVVLCAICSGTGVLVERSSGELASIELGEQPQDTLLRLRFPTTLSFDAELAFARRDATGGAFPSIEGTPPSARFHLEFLQAGEPRAALDCDPAELLDAVLSIDEAGTGRTRYRITGSLPECSTRLEPGTYLLRGRTQRLAAAESAGLVGSRIQARFKRHLF